MKKTQNAIIINPEDLEGRSLVWIDFGINRGQIHISLHKHGGFFTCWINKRIKSIKRHTYRY